MGYDDITDKGIRRRGNLKIQEKGFSSGGGAEPGAAPPRIPRTYSMRKAPSFCECKDQSEVRMTW